MFVVGAEHLRADAVYIRPDREQPKGLAEGVEIRFQPPATAEASRMAKQDVYVIRGREVQVIDSHNLEISEGGFSTCPFGHHHFEMAGERVRVVRHDPSLFVQTWQPSLRAGGDETRLAGLPFLGYDLGSQEGFLLSKVAVGSSTKFGFFIKTRWRPTHLGWDPAWLRSWTADLDYYGDRGLGVGTSFEYSSISPDGPQSGGELTAYYINDRGSTDDTGVAVPQSNRGLLHLEHRTRWDERWRTDAELYYMSDEGFLEEYFETLREQDKPPESYVLTRYRNDHLWLGLLIKERVNDFLTQTREYSLEAQWIGVPVGGMVYNAWVEGGTYDLELSDKLPFSDPPALLRLHTEHRLAHPFNAGPVRVDPFVRFLATYASKSVDPSTLAFSDSVLRVGGGGGVRASMDFSRSYDAASERWQLNRLRHIMTPYVQLEALPFMSADSMEFIQHDLMGPWRFRGSGPFPGVDRVDAIDERYEARFGLRQRLQTKRRVEGGSVRSVNWLELDVAAVVRRDDSVGVPVDDNFIEADLQWRVAPWLTIYSVDNRLSLGDGLDMFNLGAAAAVGEHSDFRIDINYLTDRTSLIRSALQTKLSDRYALIVQEKFDLNANGSRARQMEALVILRRFFHKWVLDIGLEYDKGDDNFAILFAFSPLEMAPFGGAMPEYE